MIRGPNGLAALAAVLRYLGATHGRKSVEKVVNVMEKGSSRTREGHLTWAAELELKGRVKSLLQLLAARFGEVPAEVTARVEAAEEGELERWTVRVLTAPTPEAVIDDSDSAGPGARSPRRPAARKRTGRAPGTRRAS